MTIEDVPAVVAQLLRRPARWAPEQALLGEYDGHERTLQVFNTELRDQLRLLEELEQYRPWLERSAGGPIVAMFFSVKQSLRHAEFVSSFSLEPPIRRVPRHAVPSLAPNCLDTDTDSGPHRRVA
jgi:hypothetical protein